jgi:hypothetical protein
MGGRSLYASRARAAHLVAHSRRINSTVPGSEVVGRRHRRKRLA